MQFTNYFVLICFLISFNSIICAKKTDKCESCTNLVKGILDNLDKTAKGNFGGGNTDWEDRKLGNYLTSETRFEEIIENTCDNADCHSTLEEHEDYLFDWFKNKQVSIKNELFAQFCVNTLKHCCPNDKYGINCLPCPKNLNKICSGNGICDGNGTRKGSGKCNCDLGYQGDLCELCQNGYYEEIKNEKSIKCSECHKSCKTTCLKSGSDGCVDCNDGWLFVNGKCDDINECSNDKSLCSNDEYCENTEGSYKCNKCDKSCNKCVGSKNCLECKPGYEKKGDECFDINECASSPSVCGKNPCENKPGSYECKGMNLDEKNFNLLKRTLFTGLIILCSIIVFYFTRHYKLYLFLFMILVYLSIYVLRKFF